MSTATLENTTTDTGTQLADFNAKARKAATRFLDRRGYEILDRDFEVEGLGTVDVVCNDNETLVFTFVHGTNDGSDGFPEEKLNRDQAERLALAWMNEHEVEPDTHVRFDVVALVVIGNDRALIRHHISALTSSDSCAEQAA